MNVLHYTETKLHEMDCPEEPVLVKLNAVSTAKRLANMVRLLWIRSGLIDWKLTGYAGTP